MEQVNQQPAPSKSKIAQITAKIMAGLAGIAVLALVIVTAIKADPYAPKLPAVISAAAVSLSSFFTPAHNNNVPAVTSATGATADQTPSPAASSLVVSIPTLNPSPSAGTTADANTTTTSQSSTAGTPSGQTDPTTSSHANGGTASTPTPTPAPTSTGTTGSGSSGVITTGTSTQTVGPKTQKTYPVTGTGASSATGKPDLAVTILDIGTVDKTSGAYTATTTLKSTDRIAVRFQVANIGTKATGAWYFNAVLPTYPSYIFSSDAEQSLNPGDRIEFTVGFDDVAQANGNIVVINADPTGSINEISKANNIASTTINSVQF